MTRFIPTAGDMSRSSASVLFSRLVGSRINGGRRSSTVVCRPQCTPIVIAAAGPRQGSGWERVHCGSSLPASMMVPSRRWLVAWFNETGASPALPTFGNSKGSNSGSLGILRALDDTHGGIRIRIFQREGQKETLLMDRAIDTELIIRTSAEQPGNSTVLKIRIENSGVSLRT